MRGRHVPEIPLMYRIENSSQLLIGKMRIAVVCFVICLSTVLDIGPYPVIPIGMRLNPVAVLRRSPEYELNQDSHPQTMSSFHKCLEFFFRPCPGIRLAQI